MLIRLCLYINLLLFVWCKAYSQTTIATAIDTFELTDTLSVLNLSNSFIIESSVDARIKNKKIEIKKFNISNSKLFISTLEIVNEKLIIVKYQYLKEDIPTLIGPKWKILPYLSDTAKLNIDNLVNEKQTSIKNNNFFSSGSFFRNINMSSSGNSDLSGGIQMQINGKLADDINISGVISDQNISIQPEGTTKDLDELDKVFLNVDHPNFTLDAGDIYFKDSLKTVNIQKKLVGLQSSLSVDDFTISSVYAGTKGIFRSLELKGRDGDQGPYQLISFDGSKDIIVLSGTEKIWVDGERLIRGENYDYTIDYSLGRVFFTPEHLIHNDSRIFIEFEYSDFQYEKSFIGGNLQNKKFGSGKISFGLYEESDIYNQDLISNNIDEKSSNENKNGIKINTYEVDENGKYIYLDSIFIYDPLKIYTDLKRYTVVFNYDLNGYYKREISENGQLYYTYIHPNKQIKGDDYYSPYDIFTLPKKKQFGYINTNYSINKHLDVGLQLKATREDTKIGKNKPDEIGNSFNIQIKIDSIKITDYKFKLEFIENNSSENYSPISREYPVQRSRLWNLDSALNQGIKERTVKSSIENLSIGSSILEFSTLKHNATLLERTKLNSNASYNLIRGSFLNFIKVKNNINNGYQRLNSLLQLNTKSINPYFTFMREEESALEKFNKIGIGFKKKSSGWNIISGIENRVNEKYEVDRFVKKTADLVSMINYNFKSKNGWKNNLLFKKRLKTSIDEFSDKENLDYSLADFDIIYNKPGNELSLNIKGRKEKSLSEELATVYDSVGTGFGQYRYDNNFNVYIPDQNGSYISYNVYTGQKKKNTKFQGVQDFKYSLPWFRKISNITVHINTRQEFLGTYNQLLKFYRPNIQDENILFADFQFRSELIFNANNNYRFWMHNDHIMSGLDPRGNQLTNNKIYGITLNKKVRKKISIRNEISMKNQRYKSDYLNKSDRKIFSWWNELELQYRFKKNIDLDLSILGGFDEGKFNDTRFNSSSKGIGIKTKYFFKKRGSLDTHVEFINVDGSNNLNFIPPEASQGYPLGRTFKIQSRFQYFITKSFSSIISIYMVDDNRYNKFLNINGELRAYF